MSVKTEHKSWLGMLSGRFKLRTKTKMKTNRLTTKDLALQAQDVFNDFDKQGYTNIGILNSLKIDHNFCSDTYPLMPLDYETIFLIFSKLWTEEQHG